MSALEEKADKPAETLVNRIPDERTRLMPRFASYSGSESQLLRPHAERDDRDNKGEDGDGERLCI